MRSPSTWPPTRAVMAALLIAALVSSACGSADPALARAQTVIDNLPAVEDQQTVEPSEADATATGDPSQPSCRLETVEDEYGFPVEVEQCDEGAIPGETPREPTPAPAPEPSEQAYQLLRDHLLIQRSCGEPGLVDAARPIASNATIPGLADVLNRALDVSARISSSCQIDETVWKAATREGVDIALEAAQILSTEEGIAYAEPGRFATLDTRDPKFFVQDVVEVISEALGPIHVVQQGLPTTVRDELWFSASHRNNNELLLGLNRNDRETNAIFVTGGSVIRSAVNEQDLAAGAAAPAVNLGIAGADGLDVLRHLESDIIGVSQPATVVIEVSYLLSHISCGGDQADRLANSIELRQQLLAGNSFTGGRLSSELLIQTRDATEELDRIKGGQNSNWYYPRRNFDEDTTATPEEMTAYGNRLLTRPLARCEDFIARLPATLGAVEQAGIRAVVVSLPIPPTVRAAEPGWEADFTALSATLLEYATATGAELVDLSSVLTDDQFSDFVLPNASGRAVITEQLGLFLNAQP